MEDQKLKDFTVVKYEKYTAKVPVLCVPHTSCEASSDVSSESKVTSVTKHEVYSAKVPVLCVSETSGEESVNVPSQPQCTDVITSEEYSQKVPDLFFIYLFIYLLVRDYYYIFRTYHYTK